MQSTHSIVREWNSMLHPDTFTVDWCPSFFPQDASAMHYHFLLVWRLLACLPPSVAYVDTLAASTISMGNGYILHTLRWVPRLAHKVFAPWLKVSGHGLRVRVRGWPIDRSYVVLFFASEQIRCILHGSLSMGFVLTSNFWYFTG